MAEKTVFQSQLEDEEAFAFVKSHKAVESAVESVRAGVPEGRQESGFSKLEEAASDIGVEHLESALESLRSGETQLDAPDTSEAIIMLTGYPSMLVQNGDFDASPYGVWQERLDPYRAKIKPLIAGVGRVELKNHPSGMPWVGTCWLIDDDVLITNRHVAKFFSQMRQGKWDIMPGVQVNVDFAEELGSKEALESLIGSIIHIEDQENIDMALMKLARGAAGRFGLSPIPLDTRLSQVEYIGTIGYPADDLRNNPRDAFTNYFKGQFGVKRFAPGKIMEVNYNREQFTHNCTTLGGNSGSMVFNVASGGAIGLHFGGNAQVQNFAVKAASITTVLGKKNLRPHPLRVGPEAGRGVGDERRGGTEDFSDRNGYDPGFLGDGALNVPLPIIGPHMVDLVARTKAGEAVIKYRNFSVVVSKPRRLAIFTAVNIDGTSSRNPRRARAFQLDPRLDAEQQTGDAMYKRNDLDCGHLVRRLDPCWGDEDKSNQANNDSMYYPNISPQHKDLNQKLWSDLEDHVLGTVDDRDFRVSVFTGCIFKDTDPEQQRTNIKVPMAFYKVIVSLSRDSGRGRRGRDSGSPQLQTQAFVMSQAHLVKPGDLEFVFGKGFETFQVTLEQLERMTGLDFHKMKASDTFGMTPEARASFAAESTLESAIDIEHNEHFKPLKSLDDIVM